MFRYIRTKILIAQVSLILVTILILGGVAYWLTLGFLMDAKQVHLEQTARYLGESLDALITNKERIIDIIANGEPMTRFAQKYQTPMLMQYFLQYQSEFPVLAYVNNEGQEQVKLVDGDLADDLGNIVHIGLYQEALDHVNSTVVQYPRHEGDTARMHIEFAHCLKTFFDELEGMIVARIPVGDLVKHVNRNGFSKTGTVVLLDDSGYMLMHPEEDRIGQKMTGTGQASERLLARARAMTSGFGRATLLGIDGYVAYVPVVHRNWIAMAMLPYDEFMAVPHTLRNLSLAILTIVLGLGYLLSGYLATNIARPIMRLAAAADRVARGDFSEQVEMITKDEIGMLCDSFNRMTSDLRKTTTSIENLNSEMEQRKQAETQQALLLQKPEAANQELKEFAYIVSHDLKAPLRGIKNIAGWIQTDYADKLDQDGIEKLNMMCTRVDRMKALIEGVLQYSRAGQSEEEWQEVDLNKIVSEVVDLLAVPEHIQITVQKDLPKVLYGSTRITQVFQNLISNAVKYMDKPEGRIRVAFTQDNDWWTFSVSDNGPGIEKEYFEKIFGVFQTLHPRDQYESTGIGLAVVKKIVEMAGGRVWVVSEVGKGCTFFFTVPKHPQPEKISHQQTTQDTAALR